MKINFSKEYTSTQGSKCLVKSHGSNIKELLLNAHIAFGDAELALNEVDVPDELYSLIVQDLESALHEAGEHAVEAVQNR